ncbi:uncharacterized protein LOC117136808 [Drosophila mauritiana]|uniref:Uncharacterized protein LOC117136808 n=1 Tax=Drosophila mauritiana TaxID=7226 RepID=A0A6P8JDS1_DROMA|nr:uncharacterized protein LOC117136808 [Drosophila mauritiana]
MGGWNGAGDATDETADQAQCKKVKGRRPQESPSKSAAQLVAVAARPILLRCPPFPDSLEQLGAPQSWKLVCFSVKVLVELLGFLALLAYIPSAYIVRCLLDKDRDTRTQGRRRQDQDGKPQRASRQDSRKRFHI